MTTAPPTFADGARRRAASSTVASDSATAAATVAPDAATEVAAAELAPAGVSEAPPVEVAAFDATTAPSVDIEDPESHLTHARREVAVGAGLGLAAIALAPLPVLFAQLMANAVYSPTFSLLGLHLLWAAAAFLAVGQGVRMWRMARWAGAHEDEELLERTAQLTLWVGAALMPLLALVALLTAVLL